MGKRKPRKGVVVEATASRTSTDEIENGKLNGETSSGCSDDPLAIMIDSTKSTKRRKIPKKSPEKRSHSEKKKQGGKKAKQADKVTEKSSRRPASNKKEDNETNKNGDSEQSEEEEEHKEQSNEEEEEDYEIPKKSPEKRSYSEKKKHGGKKAKQDDKVTEKSSRHLIKSPASNKKEDNETNKNGDSEQSEKEEEHKEQSNEEEEDYEIPKKSPEKRSYSEKKQSNEEEEEDYEVESIVDVRYVKSGAREFLIHWKNCSSDDDTWEPEDNLSCPDLITKFMDKETTSKGAKSKKKEVKKAKKTKKSKEISAEPSNPTAEYEVEKIIEVHHKKNGGKEFLVRWKGCTSEEDTWEPEENLSCPDLISKLMEKVEKLSNVNQREIRVAPKHTQHFTLTMKSTGRRTSKRNDNKQRTTYYDAE